jgi:hypothetical protein
MQQFYELIKIFIMTWIIGYIISSAKYSSFTIENKILRIVLFIVSKRPVPIGAILWQFINYTIFIFGIINIVVNIIDFQIIMYVYYSFVYYGIFALGGYVILDVLLLRLKS